MKCLLLLMLFAMACLAYTDRIFSVNTTKLPKNRKLLSRDRSQSDINRRLLVNNRNLQLQNMLRAKMNRNLARSIISGRNNRKLDLNMYKKRVYNMALDERKETRDLRSCWVDDGGRCCSNNRAGCQYYRRKNKSMTRTNIFFLGMMSFLPGNFWYNRCNVQCVCTSYHASCSNGAITTPALHTTTTITTTTTTAAATTTTTTTSSSMTTTAPATTVTTTNTITTVTTSTPTTTITSTTITTTTATTTTAADTTTTLTTASAASTTAASAGSDTTSASETTPTTTNTISTTGLFRSRYCPASATTQANVVRLLYGHELTGCWQYPGIVTVVDALSEITMCTGIVTSSTVVKIPNNCAQLFSDPMELTDPSNGNVLYDIPPLSDAVLNELPFGGPYEMRLDNGGADLSAFSCPGVACVYTTSMAGALQRDKCVVVAGGYTGQMESDIATLSFLKVKRLMGAKECNITNNPQDVLFDSQLEYHCLISEASSTCVGDVGGAVVCALDTGEAVVVGQVENIPCNIEKDNIIFFYPFDGFTTQRSRNRLLLTQNSRTKTRVEKSRRRNALVERAMKTNNGAAKSRRMQLLLGKSNMIQLLLG